MDPCQLFRRSGPNDAERRSSVFPEDEEPRVRRLNTDDAGLHPGTKFRTRFSEDLEYLEAILDRGSFIGMDRFGLDMILPTEKRVATIAALCQRGRADKLVLSHDACCHIDFFPAKQIELATAAPNWNFRHIPEDVVPALRKQGVSEEQIRSMTVDNPRRIFEAQGTY